MLGREVGGSAHHRAGARQIGVGIAEHRGDAEVGDFDLSVAGDQHVARLHVAVDDTTAVGDAECGRDVARDFGGAIRVERTLCADEIGQAATVDEFHDDEVRVVLLAPVEDADDVRVIQVGRGLRLPPEALDERGVGGEVGEQDLDRHRPIEQAITSEEDIGHPTAREASLELVPAVEDGR